MKKLYLICDEWDSNKNFVGGELNIAKQYFDITVIYNGHGIDEKIQEEVSETYKGVTFVPYYRHAGVRALTHFFKCITDKAFYEELKYLKGEGTTLSKISEIIRFYINGELFYDFLKKNGYAGCDEDVIYYTYWYFWKCFALTKHRDELGNAKLVTRVHGYDLYRDQIPTFYQPFKHFMDKRLDRICFIAEHGLEYYLNTYGIAKSEKHVLYKLGTKDYGVSGYNRDHVIHVVSCASLIELKRIKLIPEALSCISDFDIEWVHFGGGELFNDIDKTAKEKLSPKKNIKYRLAGQVSNNTIMEYYRNNSIDAFVMTSRSEGNPISVIEAMAFGIPVIAANISNIPYLVKGNGIIISDNPTPQELADAICDIAKMSDNDILCMREKSREIWENEYKSDVNDNAFVEEILMRL